jgi:hypothetical protein
VTGKAAYWPLTHHSPRTFAGLAFVVPFNTYLAVDFKVCFTGTQALPVHPVVVMVVAEAPEMEPVVQVMLTSTVADVLPT